jgi:hypothetical protein
MSHPHPPSHRAPLAEYQREADALLAAVKSGNNDAEWRFKWNHPRFRGKSVADVKAAALDLADAQLLVAQENHFVTWADLAEFTDAVSRDGPVRKFETAADAVIAGDIATLRAMLLENPGLVRARSTPSPPRDVIALHRSQRRRELPPEDAGQRRRGHETAA